MPPPTAQEVVSIYRQLYKSALRAVQYSKPARFVVKDRIRKAFRDNLDGASNYDPARIARTLEFLDGAGRVKGLEHKILKNLMHVWWEQKKLTRVQARNDIRPFRRRAYDEFDATIEKLNETMGLCVK